MAKVTKRVKEPASFQKMLSPLVILSIEKTKVTKMISELSPFLDLKSFPETGH